MTIAARLLLIGDWQYPIYEEALSVGFSRLGLEVVPFSCGALFPHRAPVSDASRVAFGPAIHRFLEKVQDRFRIGPLVTRLNHRLLRTAERVSPDIVFFQRPTHILRPTVKRLRETGARILAFNNDDPFSPLYSRHTWRHFFAICPFLHHLFVYRPHNLSECMRQGIEHVSVLMPYYIRERNFRIAAPISDAWKNRVVFIGHFEPDGRDQLLLSLVENGVPLRLFGTDWHRSPHFERLTRACGDISRLDEEYNLALNGTEIALAFFSRLNRDVYTRRCFEIPAAGTFMLCQHSREMESLLEEGREAEYFRSPDELIRKVKYYLDHPTERRRIADAGHARMRRDGHEVTDRAREILAFAR